MKCRGRPNEKFDGVTTSAFLFDAVKVVAAFIFHGVNESNFYQFFKSHVAINSGHVFIVSNTTTDSLHYFIYLLV